MGSEQGWNKNDDSATSFQPSQPSLCTNRCGFFGAAATKGLCSKCHRDLRMKEEVDAVMEKSFFAMQQKFAAQIDAKTPSLFAGSSVRFPAAAASTAVGGECVFAFGRKGSEQPPCDPGRCGSCKKKVGLTGFKCKCGITFCGTHRYPEVHKCSFDFKAGGRDEIAKANPLVKADKHADRI